MPAVPTEDGTSPVVSGIGMEASEPMNSSGHGGLMFNAWQRSFLPASASSRFRDITSGIRLGEVNR